MRGKNTKERLSALEKSPISKLCTLDPDCEGRYPGITVYKVKCKQKKVETWERGEEGDEGKRERNEKPMMEENSR